MRIKNNRQINKSEVSHAILSDGTKITPSTNVSLASILGEKRNVPGRKYSGTTALLTYKDCEYLYLTNGYLANAIDTEAAAIVRNGIEIVPTKTSDKKQLDLILQHNDIELLVHEIARNVDIYGVQFVELYDDP
ncbi:MAG: hypothetical protein Q8880_12870, partial [Bacteroidota bacterium]|nr:hypothetical protein [Bacteroidota bacterium]